MSKSHSIPKGIHISSTSS